MKLIDIVADSCFATIATIKGEESIEKFDYFLPFNESMVKRFPHVIISTNSVPDVSDDIIQEYHNRWRKIAPNCVILHSKENKGHMFGTIDLEENILSYIKNNIHNLRYLWKSMDDVIVTSDIFDLIIDESEFYYLPGFSYESIIRSGSKENLFNIYEISNHDFWTPQTTFFILDIRNVDSLYGNDVFSKMDFYIKEKAWNPNLKPWDLNLDIKFDCETHLGRTTSSLKKFNLLGDFFKNLLDLVEIYKIGDPSHKNIYFENIGVCHYHFYKDLIYNI